MKRWGMLLAVLTLLVLVALEYANIFGFNWALLPFLLAEGLYVGLGFRAVKQEKRHVVELIGQFSRILYPGLNWILWPFERVRVEQSISEQVVDLDVEGTYTQDNIRLDVKTTYYYRVLMEEEAILRSVYNIEQPLVVAISKHLNSTFRNIVGKKKLDEMQNQQDQVNLETRNQASEAARNWGVEITRHNIREIIPPEGIRTALLKIVTAQKDAAAVRIAADAAADAVRAAAEAEKARLEKEAEGMKSLTRALQEPGGEKALLFNLADDYIKEFGQLAKSSTTTIIPADVANVGGLAGLMQKLLESLQRKPA